MEAVLLAATRGRVGASYCVGGASREGSSERNNRQVVEEICTLMDQLRPRGAPHARLITLVSDRPGHDRRYSNDSSLIHRELGWQPSHTLAGSEITVRWFIDHLTWFSR